MPRELGEVFNDRRFIGLWTYRPHGGTRGFSASVMVKGEVHETDMFSLWESAVIAAAEILDLTEAGE